MKHTKAFERKIHEIEHQMGVESRSGDLNRARSVMVGTAFGGTTEIGMRANDGRLIWALMQPVEVIELIHQLAANVGCHIQLAPRRDFSSWRNWNVSEEERKHLNGHPPFPSDMALSMHVGKDVGYKNPPEPEMLEDNSDADKTVAIEKPRKRARAKRAAASS